MKPFKLLPVAKELKEKDIGYVPILIAFYQKVPYVAQAKLDVLKQMENLKDVETSQRAELRKTLLDLGSLKAQLNALELSLESAKESLRLSTERYKFGVANQLEVLDAINNYNSLLESYYYTLYLYNTSLARLERLTR